MTRCQHTEVAYNDTQTWCETCGADPDDINYRLAQRDASLGVGHIWTATSCPAYRTFTPSDCTCKGA